MAVAGLRRRHAEEEGESVFVSMTDLTVSFLFILLVLLAFFATQVQPEEVVRRSEHEALELELSAAKNTIGQLDEALETERERLQRLERERRDLAEHLAEADYTIIELRALMEALRAELAVATVKIDTLSAQIALLQLDLQRVRTQRDDARAQVVELSIKVEQLARALDACRRNRARLTLRLAEMPDPDSLAAYVEEGFAARARLLERLVRRIRHSVPTIRDSVSTIDGVIRFRTERLFEPGEWRIREDSRAERVAHAVGDALAETLPCYTLSPGLDTEVSCEGAVAAIETIQIEGHTDDVGLSVELQEREQMLDNYDLSARRGAETLRVMMRKRPELRAFLNLRGQPVLSFAGYGETRPINQAGTEEARAQNRRIDIRFILQTPRNLREVEEIRSQLTRRRADLPAVVNESRP